MREGFHKCFLFMVLTAILRLAGIARRKMCGAAQPAGQNGFLAQGSSLARENDKDCLRDFFGEIRVRHLPSGGRIDQGYVTLHEHRKSFLGILPHISREQFGVIQCVHLSSNVRWRTNPTDFFWQLNAGRDFHRQNTSAESTTSYDLFSQV
jgi:hypothetical protein